MSDIAIKVDHVSKSFKLPHEKQGSLKNVFINILRKNRTYESQTVLNDISFEIKKGEFYGIVGRNGSGKSTLLKLMAGIYSTDEGTIGIDGKLTPFIELGVGFNPELTGRENVYLNGALLGFTRGEMKEMYDEIVDFAELQRFMDQKLKNYSSGMQVRLAFSIAIRAKSDILLIDEVLAVGDINFQEKCLNYFNELKRDKVTVIFVSHDGESMKKFCERSLYLVDGRIKSIGRTQDIIEDYVIDMQQIEEKEKKPEKDNEKKKEKEAKKTLFLSEIVSDLKVKLASGTVISPGDPLELDIEYTLSKDFPIELRAAVVKNGFAVAHINSLGKTVSSKQGINREVLRLETVMLLEGRHEINFGIFDHSNDKQLAMKLRANKFYVKAQNNNYGGFFKISGEWSSDGQ